MPRTQAVGGRDDRHRKTVGVLRQNLIPLSGRRPMLSRHAKERLGDCRQEGRPAVRVRRAATEGRRIQLDNPAEAAHAHRDVGRCSSL